MHDCAFARDPQLEHGKPGRRPIPVCWSVFAQLYRPNLDTRKPIIVPPTAPMPMMGAYAFVMMASGMLSNNPNTRPTHHPGQGRRAAPIANPMPKRAIKAAVIAALLSGN